MKTFEIPVIPVPDLVFFPYTSIPIYIEEPVYVQMVKTCITEGLPIALSMAEVINSNPESMKISYHPKSVCTLGHAHHLEDLPNGAIKIFVKGQARIELLSVVQNLPYLVCEARLLTDFEETLQYDDGKISRLRTILNQWLNRHVLDSLERENFLKNITSIYHIVDHLCMFIINDVHMRQMLLENTSLNERVQVLNALLQGQSPLQEDRLVVSAFRSFETIEKTAKVQH